MFGMSRRSFVREAAIGTAVAGTVGSASQWLATPALAAGMNNYTGCITGNDPTGYLRFTQYLGRKPTLALLAFNQSSPGALWSSVPYICLQGAAFTALGAQVLWSVPCPGGRQLEAIVAGSWDSQYIALFKGIVASSRNDGSRILIRLPWEFNLSWQENAAMDKSGRFNATLFIKAFQHLATLAKNVSSRFMRIWCPNVCSNQLDPQLCWPGTDFVEYVAQDFYMQKAYNKPGDFNWFLNDPRGLLWGLNFAKLKGRGYALSEWGMDCDTFVGDFNACALWLEGMGPILHHHCWWDSSDVIDCRIADGTHPGLAAAYKLQFRTS